MKQLFALFSMLFVLSAIPAHGQDEETGLPILQTSRLSVAVPTPSGATPCPQNFQRSLTFDLTPINVDSFLDIAIGFSDVSWGFGYVNYVGFQDYNNESGKFPDQNGDFLSDGSQCTDDGHIHRFIFGQLRAGDFGKDLAVLRSSGTYLYLNTGDGMETSPNQTLSGGAINGSWGAFNSGDNYPDLAVTNGSGEIRIYNSNNDGTVNSTPTTISTSATHAILAQMDKPTYYVGSNKWDLISYYGNTISVRINNNNNGFGSPQEFQFGTGEGSVIASLAVGDINGDDFNDLVVVGNSGIGTRTAKLFLNDTTGTLNTTPAWTYTVNDGPFPSYPSVSIADMGAPGDTARNDGRNDIVIVGYEAQVLVFLNTGPTAYFGSMPDQFFFGGGPYSAIPRKILLADVQNSGGLSLIYDQNASIYIHKHTGNPSPAPPKNVGVVSVPRGYGNYNDAKITWRANIERDLAGYLLERRITGVCGNGNWYVLAQFDDQLRNISMSFQPWAETTALQSTE